MGAVSNRSSGWFSRVVDSLDHHSGPVVLGGVQTETRAQDRDRVVQQVDCTSIERDIHGGALRCQGKRRDSVEVRVGLLGDGVHLTRVHQHRPILEQAGNVVRRVAIGDVGVGNGYRYCLRPDSGRRLPRRRRATVTPSPTRERTAINRLGPFPKQSVHPDTRPSGDSPPGSEATPNTTGVSGRDVHSGGRIDLSGLESRAERNHSLLRRPRPSGSTRQGSGREAVCPEMTRTGTAGSLVIF